MSARNLLMALFSLLLFSGLSQAKDRPFLDEPEDTRHDYEEKPWKEGEFQLPDQYLETNLREFQVDSAGRDFRYFIDRSSLQTTTDGVTRFVLVIRSRNGVDNSSYEGMRCGKRDYRVYAYGSKQGFKSLPATGWKRISQSGPANYRYTLYNDLVCNSNKGKANPPDDVFRAMQENTKVNNSLMLQD